MVRLPEASNVILSLGLATQGIDNALAETNVGYYRWFDGAQDTLVGLFGMLQRERAAIDESHMARLFVLSLKKAWFEDCAGAPENRCFDNETVKDFVVDGCFDRVWDSVCRVSHLVTDDEMENFLDAATSILANANGERDEAAGFWERVLEEQVTPADEFYLNARQCALSSEWLRRPDVFRTLAQKHLRKNDHQDPYHTMHEAWEFFLLHEKPEQSSGAGTEEQGYEMNETGLLTEITELIKRIKSEEYDKTVTWYRGSPNTLKELFEELHTTPCTFTTKWWVELFVESLSDAWWCECVGTPAVRSNSYAFNDSNIRSFVDDHYFRVVWRGLCRTSFIVSEDNVYSFYESAKSYIANNRNKEFEEKSFWGQVIKEQTRYHRKPDESYPSDAWVERPELFLSLQKTCNEFNYDAMCRAWDAFVLYESSPVTKEVEPERIENMATENKPSDGINELQSGLSAVLGMHATAWKDAAVHRGGEVVNTAITETALKAAPATLRLWIGADKPSNWKRHAFKLLASSMAAGVARWTGNSRFQRLANAALVAAWTDAMRMLPIEEWIRAFLNSNDIAKAEALLDGEYRPDPQAAKIEELTAQLAELTAMVKAQGSEAKKH